jgi:hypothetical protein
MSAVNAIVEGDLDEAVALRLIVDTGHDPGVIYGRRGIGYIREKVSAFNRSANQIAYLTMIDLMDTRLPCAPEVVRQWLPHPNRGMLLRIVVREIESWLLADREGIAAFLAVPLTRVPINPEQLPDPKQALVNVARKSRRRRLRQSLVPAQGSVAQTGRLYVTELRAFVQNHWDVTNAAMHSVSLAKCLGRLRAFAL